MRGKFPRFLKNNANIVIINVIMSNYIRLKNLIEIVFITKNSIIFALELFETMETQCKQKQSARFYIVTPSLAPAW